MTIIIRFFMLVLAVFAAVPTTSFAAEPASPLFLIGPVVNTNNPQILTLELLGREAVDDRYTAEQRKAFLARITATVATLSTEQKISLIDYIQHVIEDRSISDKFEKVFMSALTIAFVLFAVVGLIGKKPMKEKLPFSVFAGVLALFPLSMAIKEPPDAVVEALRKDLANLRRSLLAEAAAEALN